MFEIDGHEAHSIGQRDCGDLQTLELPLLGGGMVDLEYANRS
jgi:hypothetical protein